jgi:organic hydroperoxide reductase OsmC/OhrA
MDEPPSLGSLKGPNASSLLAAFVASCLSASLFFCLRKSRIEVEEMEAGAEPTVERNEAGYWRVKKVDVSIRVKLHEAAIRERMNL